MKTSQEKSERFLKALSKGDRNALIKRGFRVLEGVRLLNLASDQTGEVVYFRKSNVKRENKVHKQKNQNSFFTKKWSLVRKFSNKQQPQEFLMRETCWKLDENRIFNVSKGRKIYYQCSWKMRTPNKAVCGAEIYFLYQIDSDEVSLYKNDSLHLNHSPDIISKSSKGFNSPSPKNDFVLIENRATSSSKPVISDSIPNQSLGSSSTLSTSATLSCPNKIADDAVEEEMVDWTLEKKFDVRKIAMDYMEKWNLVGLNIKTTKHGLDEYFTCKLVNLAHGHCPASHFIRYTKGNIMLYKREVLHLDSCTNLISHPTTVIYRARNKVTSGHQPDVEVVRWVFEKEFRNVIEAKKYLENEGIWTYSNEINPKTDALMYQCNFARCSGQLCPAGKYIQVIDKNLVSLYKTAYGHDHDPPRTVASPEEAYHTLSDETKSKLKQLLSKNYTAVKILNKLQLVGFDISFQQFILDWIRNTQRDIRIKKFGITDDIKNWLTGNFEVPNTDEQHKYYCVDFDADSGLQCFLSTRFLLKNAVGSNSVHIDTVNKLNWQKNSIIFIGRTDAEHKYHLFGIGITSRRSIRNYEFLYTALKKGVFECYNHEFKPEYLIADDNACVLNPFIKVFGAGIKIGTRPQDALTRIFLDLSAAKCDYKIKQALQQDIINILTLPSRTLFLKAVELFNRKWKPSKDHLADFLLTFRTHWIQRITHWFDVLPNFTPVAIRALRLEYNLLKNHTEFDSNMTMDSFSDFIQKYIEDLSRSYEKNGARTADKLEITNWTVEMAIAWINLEKQYLLVDEPFKIRFYIAAGNEKFICIEKLGKYRACDQENLDEFFDIYNSFYCVEQTKNSNTFTCNCPYFYENIMCEHAVGMAMIRNLYKG